MERQGYTYEEKIIRTEEQISGLKNWQKMQNGTLQKLENKIEKVDDKVDNLTASIHKMTVGGLFGLMVVLIQFIYTVLIR